MLFEEKKISSLQFLAHLVNPSVYEMDKIVSKPIDET